MKSIYKLSFVLLLSITLLTSHAQNETKKWYFGYGAALDFVSGSPVNISSTTWSNTSFASMADASGNLLFFTNGINIWTSANTLMANGTNLLGTGGSNGVGNSILIVQQPSSPNLYYIFAVLANYSSSDGLYYSIVDMSLAAGQGSVTIKNVQIYSGSLCKKLSGTKHFNGNDFWIVSKDCSNTNTNSWNGISSFRAYQLSASGLNTTPAVSTFTYNSPSVYANAVKVGQMKISPASNRLACANYAFSGIGFDSSVASIELYDFSNSTGQVSNFFPLYIKSAGTFDNASGWGVEFSPDASKLYGTLSNNYYHSDGSLIQWDLCQSSNTAIASSSIAIATPSYSINGFTSMQLAPDGKIYISPYNFNTSSLSVIHAPDQYGSAVNFSLSSLSLSPGYLGFYLPGFMSSSFFLKGSVPAFSLSLVSGTLGCQQIQLQSPLLVGAAVGSCSANSYTLQGLHWDFGDPSSGSNNYSTLQNPIHNFSSSNIFNIKLTLDFGAGRQHVITQTISAQLAPTASGGPGILNHTGTLSCTSVNTGTASYNGTPNPNFTYFWTNGSTSYSTPITTNLSGGTWTSVVTNTLTSCVFYTVFTIQQTPGLTITPITSPQCFNSQISANVSGGTGPLYYLWSNLTTSSTNICTTSGTNSVTVTDANGCSTNVQFTVLPPIQLAATGASICAGNSASLHATGVSNYTWSSGNVVTPTITSNYTLTAESNGCYKDTVITVHVYPKPIISINATTYSICANSSLTLNAQGAVIYFWSNNSVGASIIYSNATAGIYTISVHGNDANSCSNSATVQLNVMNCLTGIKDHYLNTDMNVYPNPSSGDFNIKAEEGQAFLYNSLGELVWKRDIADNKHFFIEISGVYFLRLELESKVVIYKLIVH